MGMMEKLATMLGLSRDDAEASMHSERAARHVLSRRSAIGLGAAMCAGTLFSEVPVSVYRVQVVSFTEMMKKLYPQQIAVVADFQPAWTITHIDRQRGIITVGSE